MKWTPVQEALPPQISENSLLSHSVWLAMRDGTVKLGDCMFAYESGVLKLRAWYAAPEPRRQPSAVPVDTVLQWAHVEPPAHPDGVKEADPEGWQTWDATGVNLYPDGVYKDTPVDVKLRNNSQLNGYMAGELRWNKGMSTSTDIVAWRPARSEK